MSGLPLTGPRSPEAGLEVTDPPDWLPYCPQCGVPPATVVAATPVGPLLEIQPAHQIPVGELA